MVYQELERALSRYFHLQQISQMDGAKLDRDYRIFQLADPAYRINNDGTADISCDAFTYHVYQENSRFFCRVEISRIQACASVLRPECLLSVDILPVQVMYPWEYPKGTDPFASLGNYPCLPRVTGAHPEEIPAIRNLCNLFFEHRLHETCNLFIPVNPSLTIEYCGISGAPAAANTILKAEYQNHHCYLFLGTSSMPVIEVADDGNRAESLGTALLYRVDAGDRTKMILHRTFATVKATYERMDDGWKIAAMEIRNLLTLPDAPYGLTGRYDRCGTDAPWQLEQTCGNIPDAGTLMEIENIIHCWAYSCRQGTLPGFVRQYMENPLGRNRLWIRSFGDSTPILDTLEKITGKITDMTSQYRDGYYTFHAPTTPVIRQLSETLIRGTWYDCAATSLRSAAKSPEDIPYMTFVNKYCHDFERIDGKWYLTSFKNEPILSLPDWHLDMVHNTGWLGSNPNEKFPDAFREERL